MRRTTPKRRLKNTFNTILLFGNNVYVCSIDRLFLNTFPMRICLILIGSLVFSNTPFAHGQGLAYQISKDWGLWQTVKNDSGVRVEISFKMSEKCDGYSYYRIYNNWTLEEGSSLEFGFEYLDCDDQVKEQAVDVILSKAGIDQDPGMWFSSNKLYGTHFRIIKFYDAKAEREKEKAKAAREQQEELERLDREKREEEQRLALQKEEEQRRQVQIQRDEQKKLTQQTETRLSNQFQQREEARQQVVQTLNNTTNAISDYVNDRQAQREAQFQREIAREDKERYDNKTATNEATNEALRDYIISSKNAGGNESSLEYYQESAAQGNAVAQYSLGIKYRDGQDVDQNFVTAADWLTKASNQGLAMAQAALGELYRDGKGVTKDYKASYQLFFNAAQQNNAQGEFDLALAYDEGWGCNKSTQDAIIWFEKIVEQQSRIYQGASAYNLGNLYNRQKNVDEAVKWYRKALELDNGDIHNLSQQALSQLGYN
jgi:TPR repeat protein